MNLMSEGCNRSLLTNQFPSRSSLRLGNCFTLLCLLAILSVLEVVAYGQAEDFDSALNIMAQPSQPQDPGCFYCTAANNELACSEEGPAPLAGAPMPGVISGQHIRSPLAKAVYNKLREDEINKVDRHIYWYRVIVNRLNENLQQKFIQCEQDESADEFLDNCREKSDSIMTQVFYSLARPVLNFFMTQTSINGLLNRGSMYIFSKPQFEKLMNYSPYHKRDTLLDLGAGDGMVTKQMAGYFKTTYATEMSSIMARRLSGHGFKVLGVDEWSKSGIKFDLVSCLNLLDRCDKPLSLLAEVKRVLRPDSGRLLVAVVILFAPYVEFESKTHQPTEFLRVTGSNFEEQVQQFVTIFRQAGFLVEKFTRLPYLCEGDIRHSFYVLTDALFVLRAATNDGER